MLAKAFVLLLSINSGATTFSEFLSAAWEKGPGVQAENFKKEESEEFIDSARGGYFPHLTLEALDTTGFPASNSDLHIGGVMGSPFRKGRAAGAVLDQTVYDFGRVASVLEKAKAERGVDEARMAQEKLRFLSTVAELYLGCAQARSLIQRNETLISLAQMILRETARFTKTGQRSIVDHALAQTELDELDLQQKELHSLESSLVEQMKVWAPVSGCESLTETWHQTPPSALMVEEPSLLLAKSQVDVAQAGMDYAWASQLPMINVTGSIGAMDQARLVPEQNYAAGIGITIPVWNGGEDWHKERAYKSQVRFENEMLKSAQLEFSAKMTNLKDAYQRDKQSLSEIEKNLGHVRETMKLASTRYRNLEGPLIDVREAFKQLSSIEQQRVQLLYSLAGTSFRLGILKQH